MLLFLYTLSYSLFQNGENSIQKSTTTSPTSTATVNLFQNLPTVTVMASSDVLYEDFTLDTVDQAVDDFIDSVDNTVENVLDTAEGSVDGVLNIVDNDNDSDNNGIEIATAESISFNRSRKGFPYFPIPEFIL